MANLLIFVVCLIIQVSLHLSASQSITRVIETTYGPVTGAAADLPTNKTVQRFLGIPFAKAGRLEYPGPPNTWTSILHANVINKICPQLLLPLVEARKVSLMSEDCLLLNIFAPQNASIRSLLPVMLWIYGGGYINGDTLDYDGSVLATEGEVIVVTAAYRLGALGFLSTDSDDLRGNYGLMDQIEALKWVNKNIARFGGDPNKVTIFGESAGGMSVALLMLSPPASGLYQNVIMQSGTAVSLYSALERRRADVRARSFAKALGCDDMTSLKACVKTKHLKDILAAQSKVPAESNYPTFAPVIDGFVLPDSPAKLLKEGRFNASNIIVGVTRDDGSVFVSSFPGVDDPLNVSEAGMSQTLFKSAVRQLIWVENQGEHQVEAIIYEYTDWSNVSDPYATRKQFIDLGTDSMFKAPAVLSASAFINHAASTFFCQLEIAPKRIPFIGSEVKPFYGIFHGADVFYTFGYPLVAPKDLTTDIEIKFTKDFITLWTNFAKTGNPNNPVPLAANWPQYTADKEEYMGLGQNFTVRSKMRPSKMAFWNEFIASLQAKAPPETTTSGLPTTPSKKEGKETLVIVLAVLTGLLAAAVLILLVVMVATSRNQKRREQSKDFEQPLKGTE